MIRPVLKKDYKQVYQLGNLLHQDYEKLYPLDKMLKYPYFHLIVYEEKGKILGFLSYTDLRVTLDILDVVVHQDYRKRHIASNLIDYAITGAHPGCEMFIEVDVNNNQAISLYEKFGFEIINTRKNYYEQTDAYVMKRVI